MATRFEGTYYSLTNEKYVVQINDTDFVGTKLSGNLTSLQIQYEGEGGERFQPILGASINFEIMVETSDIETMVRDMVGAEEGRFTIIVNKTAVNNPYQVGYILPDLITLPDSKIEEKYSVQIKATDGLARLKTIDYNNSGTAYSGYATFTEHIFNCLNKLTAITSLYSGLQAFFRVVCDWREDTRTYSANDNPLDVTRCNHVAFYTIDSKGNYNFKSCYDVLAEICKAWGARMMYSDGKFWFIQVNRMRVPAGLTVYNYRTNQSSTVLTSQDFRVSNYESAGNESLTNLKRLSGGNYRYYPPVRKVAVRYSHRSTVNMLAGVVFDDTSSAATYSNVDYYNGTGRLVYNSTLTVAIDELGTETTLFAVFNFKINVGSYYLQRDVNYSGTWYNYESPVWSVDNTAVYKVIIPVTAENVSSAYTISIYTPELQESGNLEFDVNIGTTKQQNGTDFTEIHTVTWSVENNALELLGIGSFTGQADITEYFATNDTTSNSAMIEVDTTLGDGPGLTSPGHVMILEDDNTTWSITDNWRVGNSGTYKNFSQLLVNEIISGQISPVEKLLATFIKALGGNGTIYDAYQIIDRTADSEGYWMFNGGVFNLGDDTVRGEWFELVSSTSYTEQTPIDRPSNSSERSSPSNVVTETPASGGGSDTASLKAYQQVFSSPSGNTVTITKNGGVLPSDKDAIIVIVDGRVIQEGQWSKSGSDITLSFDLYSDNEVVVFFVI